MTKQKVYLETSVISYLTARPSTDVIKLAKQELTRQWWETSRHHFEIFVARPVIEEIRAGDPDAATRRMDAVTGMPELAVTNEVNALFIKLLSANIVPEKAPLDALHIAITAVHGIDFLLTWNCTHINNAMNKPKIAEIIKEAGYTVVTLATPEELRR